MENLKAGQFTDHHKLKKSKFNIGHYSPFLNRTWFRFTRNAEVDYIKETQFKSNGRALSRRRLLSKVK